jgi:glucose/arabinose dehydrogenase
MFDGAIFDRLVQIVEHPVEPDTWFVVHHRGIVQRIRGSEVTTVLDIADRIHYGEQWGLQEIALHPKFPTDPRVFLTYVGPGSVSTVAMLRTLLDGNDVARPSPVVLFEEAQPTDWHPVGGLTFGPDGYLYIGWGYGDLDVDDPAMLRGKLLRVDVDRPDSAKPYSIPADNPLYDSTYQPATYATGLRNPWRFSFDPPTDALWLGDVGEAGYEEINRISPGKHYGWPQWEGTRCRQPKACAEFPTEPPVYQHTHAEVCAVIGGYLYRGSAIPHLRGK